MLLRRPILIFHNHNGFIPPATKSDIVLSLLFKPDTCIGVSKALQNWSAKVWGLNESHNFMLLNLPSERFLRINDIMSPEKRGDFVMVGNIKRNKNQKFAMEVVHGMGRQLTLIGKIQDQQYADSIINNPQSNCVNIIDDINDVTPILGEYKCGIFTSFYESGPLVILEYLLCGIPFLAYKTGGIADVAAIYFPEYFIDNFIVEDWCKKILEIERNHTVVKRSIVQSMLLKEFNRDRYRSKLLSIYEA